MGNYIPRRHVRANGQMGETVLHAIEIGPDDWVYSGPRWGGVCLANWESIITAFADRIGDGEIYTLDAIAPGQPIDRAGNTWLEREYLAPHEYLPRLIPKEVVNDG